MKIRIAIIAACVGTLALTVTLAHAVEPILGTPVGLEHGQGSQRMNSNGAKTVSTLRKTQQQKASPGTAKPPISDIGGGRGFLQIEKLRKAFADNDGTRPQSITQRDRLSWRPLSFLSSMACGRLAGRRPHLSSSG